MPIILFRTRYGVAWVKADAVDACFDLGPNGPRETALYIRGRILNVEEPAAECCRKLGWPTDLDEEEA